MHFSFLYYSGALFASFLVVDARWAEGTLITSNNWSFLARFCFLSSRGSLTFNFIYPVAYGTQQVLLYYDEPGQWESVYQSDKTCEEKVSVLSMEFNQIIPLDTTDSTSHLSGCTTTSIDNVIHYNCSSSRIFKTVRERWWYIAIARCSESIQVGQVHGLNVYYKLHMNNGDEQDLLHYEYSADEFDIFPVDLAFLTAYLLMIGLSIACAVVLCNRQLFHSTYKLYIGSLSLWFLGLLLMCIAWGQYGRTGWQTKPTEVTGRIFQAASTIVFILMLILMAKGFSITRGRLPHMSIVRISVFFCLFITIYITLFIWEGLMFDEALVLYFYESPPGYGLVTMRLIGWLWFLYAIFFTLKHYPKKGRFYFPFFIFFTFWFWAGPVVILVAMFAMPKWSREKTVNAVEQFVGLIGHLFFLVLTRPAAANKNFPYHVRTSQIGSLDGPDYQEGLSSDSANHPDALCVHASQDIPVGTGPNLAALFIVQYKRDENENMNIAETSPNANLSIVEKPPPYSAFDTTLSPDRSQTLISTFLPPVRGSSLPPIAERSHTVPSAPPAYQSMFVVQGPKVL